MKVTLTKVTRFDKGKDGNPLKTKDGRNYTRVVIGTEEYEKTLSGFENATTKGWKEGDEVEIEVEEKGEYLNFKVPKVEDKIDEKLEMILNRMVGLQLQLNTVLGYLKPQAKGKQVEEEYPEMDGDPAF